MNIQREIFLLLFLVFFLILIPVYASQEDLTLSPSSGNISLNQTLSVTLAADVGANKLNIVSVTLNFDAAKLSVATNGCTVNSAYTAIVGAACSVNNQAGTIKILEQAANAEGPSGSITLATIAFTGKANGQGAVTISQNDLTVKDANGQSVKFTPANIVNGSYQVGTNASTPTATNTPAPSKTPTPAPNNNPTDTPMPIPPTETVEVSTPTPVPNTNDTTPPTAPSNLTAEAVSSSQINLSWKASGDNVKVTGYDIYRNNSLIASMTTTGYGDTNLSPATSYRYYVQARDAAGNISSPSDTVQTATNPQQSGNTVQPQPSGKITGTITNSTGEKVRHARITINIKGRRKIYLTNSQGIYTISRLPDGNYTLNFAGLFYPAKTATVTVANGNTVNLDMVLQENNRFSRFFYGIRKFYERFRH
jgi:hypothetical protein